MKNKLKKKNGFTIVELIVVIAVLGILVLMAAPKFIGYAEKAKIAQIKADSKSYESHIGAERQKDDNYHRGWDLVEPDELISKIGELRLYNKRGLVEDASVISSSMKYYEIPNRTINTKLDGIFIYAEDGTVYYDGPAGKKVSTEKDSTYEDYVWISYSNQTLTRLPVSTDFLADMSYGTREVGDSNSGYWYYIGNDDVVVIPNEIQGHPVTSYYRMFAYDSDYERESLPKKIISTNKNIEDMGYMFDGFGYHDVDLYKEVNINGKDAFEYSLDLSELDTSGVVNMERMFNDLSVTYLDISTWDTSKVEVMYGTFARMSGKVVKLENARILEEFIKSAVVDGYYSEESYNEMERLESEALYMNLDTSNVTDMREMFSQVDVYPQYVSSFDTKNVEDMSGMFLYAYIMDGDSFKHFNTSKVEEFYDMFQNALVITEELNLEGWDTSNAENFESMFRGIKGNYVASADGIYRPGNLKRVNISTFTINLDLSPNLYDMFNSPKLEEVYVNNSAVINIIKSYPYGKPSSNVTFY